MDGDKQWETVLGLADSEDYLNRVLETADGGYLILGTSWSAASGNKTNENIGDSDYWFVKLDNSGNKQWEQAFGGTGEDYPWVLQPASDGEYDLAGHSGSEIYGNKTSSSFGLWEGWIFKLPFLDTPLPKLSIAFTPINKIIVAWPSSADGFSLQQNMQVNTTNWTSPAEAVNDDGANKFIIVTSPSGQKSYRLINSQ